MSDLDFNEWRHQAREAIVSEISPDCMRWSDTPELFNEALVVKKGAATIFCPRKFIDLAQTVACHRSPEKWDLLYRILWELSRGQRHLLEDASDARIHRAEILAKQVRRDIHKMTAFVRFQKIKAEPEAFMAWYEPDHFILKAALPFFVRRFGSMNWALLTPDGGGVWNQQALAYLEGPLVAPRLLNDPCEDLWRTYFANIFNPARLRIKAMKNEMPIRFWKNLPEAQLIPELVAGAGKRMQDMIAASRQNSAAAPGEIFSAAKNIFDLRKENKKLSGLRFVSVGGGPPCPAKARIKREWLLWVSSRAIRKIGKGDPLWDLPGNCCTVFWPI